MSHLSFCFQVYCCGSEKNVYTSSTLPSTHWYSLPILLANDLIQTSLCFEFFYDMSVLHVKFYVLIKDCIGYFGQIVVLCRQLRVSCQNFLETVCYQVWCVLHLIVYTPQSSLVLCIVRWCSPIYWIWLHPQWSILAPLICNDVCGCGWFWIFPCCRCWDSQVYWNSYPWMCVSLVIC